MTFDASYSNTSPDVADDHSESTRQITFKGVDAIAIERARTAARKQGMKVGAWVSARLREAAERALGGTDTDPAEQLNKLSEHVRRIEDNQQGDNAKLTRIENELVEIVKAQRTIMAQLLNER